jgi:hypothetical protein
MQRSRFGAGAPRASLPVGPEGDQLAPRQVDGAIHAGSGPFERVAARIRVPFVDIWT